MRYKSDPSSKAQLEAECNTSKEKAFAAHQLVIVGHSQLTSLQQELRKAQDSCHTLKLTLIEECSQGASFNEEKDTCL